MTYPHFDARCHHGFIASYGNDSYWGGSETSFFGFPKEFYQWLDDHCLGPVTFTGHNTAHWECHIEFSHPEDVILYKLTCRDNNVSESVNCKEEGERKIHPHTFSRIIYTGKNVDKAFLKEFLDKYPYTVKSLSEHL